MANMLIDATTAQHARGIGTVAEGICLGLPKSAESSVIITAGPDFRIATTGAVRRTQLARYRVSRLAYQRFGLAAHINHMRRQGDAIDRVLLLDSYVPVIRLGGGVRYAAFVHDALPVTQPHYWPLAKRLVKASAFWTLKRASPVLFTSSPHNAREIEAIIGAPVRLAQYGCGQLSDFEADKAYGEPLPDRSGTLVYVGALEPRKNVLSLIEAFDSTAAALGRECALLLVGNGPARYVARLEQRIRGSRYRARIRLIEGQVGRRCSTRLPAHPR